MLYHVPTTKLPEACSLPSVGALTALLVLIVQVVPVQTSAVVGWLAPSGPLVSVLPSAPLARPKAS